MDLQNSQEINIFRTTPMVDGKTQRKPHINLTIDKIYVGGLEKNEHILQQNEVVYICSVYFKLSSNQIGLLSLKKNFDRLGILTICSKTVHPSYEGPVSAQIVNISGNPIVIRRNDPFLEIMIFKVQDKFDPFPSKEDKKNYYENIKDISKRSPKYFLNIKNIQDEVINRILQEHGWGFIKKFSVVSGIVFGSIAILLSLCTGIATYKIFSYIDDYASVESIEEIETLKKRIFMLEQNAKNLRKN